MSAKYVGKDKSFYVDTLSHAMPMFSTDGQMPAEGPPVNVSLLEQSLGLKNLDPQRTYTNAYVRRSSQ